MSAKKQTKGAGEEGFDARLERLEGLVGELEGGELGLEEAMQRFADGVKLLAGCRELLAGYEKRVEELAGEAEEGLRALESGDDEE
jgi:exodeoxyribonuclease VII small subunit